MKNLNKEIVRIWTSVHTQKGMEHVRPIDIQTWAENFAENAEETIVSPCGACDHCLDEEYPEECPDVINSARERLIMGDVTRDGLVLEALDDFCLTLADQLGENAGLRLYDDMSEIATELLKYILTAILENGDIDVETVERDALIRTIEGYFDSPGVEEHLTPDGRWVQSVGFCPWTVSAALRELCFKHGLALDSDVDDLWHNGEFDLVSEQSMSTYRRMIDDIRLPKLNWGEVSTSEEMTEAIKKRYELLIGKTMEVTLCETDETNVLATIKRFDSTSFGAHPAEGDFEGCDNLIEVWAMVDRLDGVVDEEVHDGLWMVHACTILERGFTS